ncbi:outer membrane protein assembly factor BamE [Sphingomonas sp. ID0503]|uniref:outer membrane protein assembly factor BamE n=1 Tax=Sphingomonas sp. ID0503 TaxID=3399691 RepID=UPI003AFB043A
MPASLKPWIGGTLIAAIAVTGLSGCARIRDHKGYVVDSALISSVQPGVDNRQSVAGTLGRPTFASEYGDETWYYIARETRQLAFSNPKAVGQTVLAVKFDKAGNVATVNKMGMEQVVSISPKGGKTPTLGRHRSFLGELFGNIGTVGSSAGEGVGTADNPQ